VTPAKAKGPPPLVSIVIPVRNEVDSVGGAVASALAQEYDGELEVVVADAMSTDGTREALARISADDGRVRMVDNPARTTPAGLNAAIVASHGDVIVRCDAHAELPTGYVARAVAVLDEVGADNVGGLQDPQGRGVFSKAVAGAQRSLLGAGGATYRLGVESGPAETVYLGVFRREGLRRSGLFDESLLRNQDYELNHRIRAGGGLVYFDPGLRVAYQPRQSWVGLWRQYWQYGAWKRVVLRRHPDSVRLRQLIPVGFVVGLGISAGLAIAGYRRLGVVLPSIYGGAVLGTAAMAARRGEPGTALIPVVLPTMHVAWGTGFLFGAARAEPARVPPLMR
jgi:glycosyltransferase involved in cell wall biosynthesis